MWKEYQTVLVIRHRIIPPSGGEIQVSPSGLQILFFIRVWIRLKTRRNFLLSSKDWGGFSFEVESRSKSRSLAKPAQDCTVKFCYHWEVEQSWSKDRPLLLRVRGNPAFIIASHLKLFPSHKPRIARLPYFSWDSLPPRQEEKPRDFCRSSSFCILWSRKEVRVLLNSIVVCRHSGYSHGSVLASLLLLLITGQIAPRISLSSASAEDLVFRRIKQRLKSPSPSSSPAERNSNLQSLPQIAVTVLARCLTPLQAIMASRRVFVF